MELPDAVFLDVLVFVRSLGPFRAFAEPAGLDQTAPPALGRQPVGRNVDHSLEDHVVVELALGQAARRAGVELARPVLADIDTGAGDFDRRIGTVGKQFADPVAHPLVDIVAVGSLKPLDGFGIFQQSGLVLETGQFGVNRLGARSFAAQPANDKTTAAAVIWTARNSDLRATDSDLRAKELTIIEFVPLLRPLVALKIPTSIYRRVMTARLFRDGLKAGHEQ